MQNENTTGSNLLYQRKLKGFSQQELSDRTEVTVRTIQRIEKGEVQPHLQTIKLLAAALEIEVNDLLPLEDPRAETIRSKWLLLLHATPLLGFILPFLNVLLPLFLWIHKREDNPLYYRHGVKVINFQLTWLIFYALSFVALLTVEQWGFILFISILPVGLLIVIANIFYALNTHKCFYPLSIPFLGMKKRFALFAACFASLLFGSDHAFGQAATDIVRLDGTRISSDSLTRKLQFLMEAAEVPGLAVSVLNTNEVVYQQALGYKDAGAKTLLSDSTNIYGASLSKAVFGVLVMQLVEEGLIDLDTPLQSYLPRKIYDYEPQTRWHDNYSDLRGTTAFEAITARMCLAHTSGLPNWRWTEPDQKLRVHGNPGDSFSYSGEGFVFLQVVLEKLSGKGLQELSEERIFQPLGMHRSAYLWKEEYTRDFAYGHGQDGSRFNKDTDNEPRGGSTLETTAEDYTRFLKAMLQQELLRPASYQELFSSQVRISSAAQFGPGAAQETNAYEPINLGYGLGWGYFETPYGPAVFKEGNGGGFQHHTVLFPETGHGIMILSNSSNAGGIFKELLETALRDTYTPWQWEGYTPYDQKASTPSE